MNMGRRIEPKTRILGTDGEWHYNCTKCDKFKPESEMMKNHNRPFGIEKYCIECDYRYRREYTQNKFNYPKKPTKGYNTRWIEPTGRHLREVFVDYDYEDTKKYLEHVGYNLDEPIHLQFQKRIKDKYGVDLPFDD